MKSTIGWCFQGTVTFGRTEAFNSIRPIGKCYVSKYADEEVCEMHFIDAELQVDIQDF